ncbi:PTS galactosamine/N-acetylgalactosamine transporter subunit IIA [Clostridium sp. Marseille-Q2269]|uniref:PTS galactosamine/N-acetylgalactosamine transporter subunit IIA n=1 Tax=Clostridium sp. Marseille-Q2269 TaxID=2942205 RepID=UPI0020732859|nr:PTS galactosamine/N-acetylgalactosamine transporter subunit IIA [Clostridium sp. Marseille-Q2269]
MIGIIVSGHGNFATGLTSSLELIAGKQRDLIAVDFTIEDTTDTLKEKMENAMDELKHCEGLVVLTDIIGGSPFNTAVLLGMCKENVTVISGTNLGMILEGALCREGLTMEELKDTLINSGKEAVKIYENKKKKQNSCSGI